MIFRRYGVPAHHLLIFSTNYRFWAGQFEEINFFGFRASICPAIPNPPNFLLNYWIKHFRTFWICAYSMATLEKPVQIHQHFPYHCFLLIASNRSTKASINLFKRWGCQFSPCKLSPSSFPSPFSVPAIEFYVRVLQVVTWTPFLRYWFSYIIPQVPWVIFLVSFAQQRSIAPFAWVGPSAYDFIANLTLLISFTLFSFP